MVSANPAARPTLLHPHDRESFSTRQIDQNLGHPPVSMPFIERHA